GRAHPALVDWLRTHSMGGRVLVPGCGRGHDVIVLAASSAQPTVVGLDLSPSALSEARAPSRPSKRVRWVEGDFFQPPDDLPSGGFDWIWEHTCYCAIDPADRAMYVEAAARALRPGGHLLGVFFLNPRDDPDPTIGPPFNTSREALDRQFDGAFEMKERRAWFRTYPGREGREEMRLYQKR
ncbi:MAG: methyltransferase domain-containing protein, partial [Verrucomicrobiota bacterium]